MKRRNSSINRQDSSGIQENNNLDSVDRISALPDHILGIILSFLFTKYAVATSILSKRWKFLWRTVDNLSFSHWGKSEVGDMKFVEDVNRVLLLHDARSLQKFRLLWKPSCVLFHVHSLIRTAISRNVQEIFLCVENRFGLNNSPQPIEMPISVFSCESLRSLELCEGVCLCDSDAVFLPRLETLKLLSVEFKSTNAFKELINGCPMLNFLCLCMDVDYVMEYFGRDCYSDFTFVVSSTSLRRFELCIHYKTEPSSDTFHYRLILRASSLEYITIYGFIDHISVEESLSSMVEADIGIQIRGYDFTEPEFCDPFVELVREFDCAKTLILSGDVMWALNCASISLSTKFKRLVRLEAEVYCCDCSPLRDFIQNADNLKILTINQSPDYQDRDHNHTNWTVPLEVPRCLSNSLKKFVLDVYCGFGDEREMIQYMLKDGSVLEVMKISLDCFRDSSKFEFLQEICKFPRKSTVCEVEFVLSSNRNDQVNVTTRKQLNSWIKNPEIRSITSTAN